MQPVAAASWVTARQRNPRTANGRFLGVNLLPMLALVREGSGHVLLH